MLLSRLHRRLTCLLFATVTAADTTVAPSNTSTTVSGFQGTLQLLSAEGQAQIAEVVPLTQQATKNSVEGNLFNANSSNAANISINEIAYISCNTRDYDGYIDAKYVFSTSYNKGNIAGVILYSTADDYCNYTMSPAQQMMNRFAVFSMINKSASAALLNTIHDLPVHLKSFVKVQGRQDGRNATGGGTQQTSPLGPSPSTAVAMIILYSITGIITALFLVIIVTGAVRAHRHPERYGPRDVLGRPRQTRARGLGRAILDTLPIVKFGEKEPAKPTDVELGSVVETTNVSGPDGARKSVEHASNGSDVAVTPTAHAEEAKAPVQEPQEGIAPAETAIPSATSGIENPSDDNSLGCSICTEDFEKGQDLRVLPCDHKFHSECVDPWLLNVSGTCPLCRVDLRPVASHDSTPSIDDVALASEIEIANRPRTFRDLLSLRQRPLATPEERIHALRRHRQHLRQLRNRGESTAEGGIATEDARHRRMSNRMSARLSGVFTGRVRRERSPPHLQGETGEASSGVARTVPSDVVPAPAPDAGVSTNQRAAA